jgi:hypothetical protein
MRGVVQFRIIMAVCSVVGLIGLFGVWEDPKK